MQKKQFLFMGAFFAIILILSFIGINIVSATDANAKENTTYSVSGVSETTGVRYETIWVGGNRFIVFSNSSGSDIEVFTY